MREAIELGGTPTCATSFGAAFAATDEAPEVARYELDGSGQLAETGTVSFLNEGLSVIGGAPARAFVFLSETEALFLDSRSTTLVRWNPQAMTVESSFRLAGLVVDDATPTVRRVIAEGRDDLLFYVRYSRENLFAKRSALVSLNPETGDFSIDMDERCGGLFSDVQTSDGAIYLASAPHVSTYGELGIGEEGHQSCILRVAPGATTFDDDFFVPMNLLTGGVPTGGLIPAGDNGAIVFGYDDTVRDSSGFASPTDFTNASSWRVHRIMDLTALPDATAAPVEDFPLQTGRVSEVFNADGRRYLLRVGPLFSSSTFQDITDVDNVTDGLTVRGAIVASGGAL
ncbi:MAG: hypothetical protein AAGE52_20425 [Myxococcota bacterium]